MASKSAKPLGQVDFENPDEIRAYNRRLFKIVAPAYQRVTGVLSFGQDKRWKSNLVARLPPRENPVCIDLACGTGDLLALVKNRYPHGVFLGLDQSPEMMTAGNGQSRDLDGTILIKGDLNALPLRDASVDLVTGGYALRNAPDLDLAIEEIARILQPGGVAGFLDFSKPKRAVLAQVELGLLKTWGNIWGTVFHHDKNVYGYIAKSLARFPDRRALTEKLRKKGLETLKTAYPFFGLLELRWVLKK